MLKIRISERWFFVNFFGQVRGGGGSIWGESAEPFPPPLPFGSLRFQDERGDLT
ncbi:MAG: hypothetical protein HYS86_04225 [Candidatus Chisholmbacteria bacterium]|nr:hypothetical protein [Candidatus Chisholmbacteria bacterium]